MPYIIVNFYIEVPENKQVDLERLLSSNGFAFYDATNMDCYTKANSNFDTLESIEADIECK
jgi:hypothetical protein